jgi:hypothetical protein
MGNPVHDHITLDVHPFRVAKTFKQKLWDAKDDIFEMLKILDTHGKGIWNEKLPEKKGAFVTEELTGTFASSESTVEVSVKFKFYGRKKKRMLKKTDFNISMRLRDWAREKVVRRGGPSDWDSHVQVLNGNDALWGKMSKFFKEHKQMMA